MITATDETQAARYASPVTISWNEQLLLVVTVLTVASTLILFYAGLQDAAIITLVISVVSVCALLGIQHVHLGRNRTRGTHRKQN